MFQIADGLFVFATALPCPIPTVQTSCNRVRHRHRQDIPSQSTQFLSATLFSSLFFALNRLKYVVTRLSAHTHPPTVIAAIWRKTLNCGVRPW